MHVRTIVNITRKWAFTKQTTEIPASSIPTFKAGKALKDSVAK